MPLRTKMASQPPGSVGLVTSLAVTTHVLASSAICLYRVTLTLYGSQHVRLRKIRRYLKSLSRAHELDRECSQIEVGSRSSKRN